MPVQRRYYLGAAALISITILATMAAYPHLPSIVPVRWDAPGDGTAFGPKSSLFLYMPGLMTGIVLMFVALPWLSPRRFEENSFRPTYLHIMIVIVALLSYSQFLVLASGLGVNIEENRALEGGVCMLIVLLGSVMGRVRRNFLVAIRTPWTLANEQVWAATHRFAAKTMVGGGALALIAVAAGSPLWLPATAILMAAFVPAFYSLVLYRQLERQNGLS
ncbi:MAG TPA: SdpI family protein [Candidatus Sulfotelmatobacter sp.]|nr:SdpI family protein [Candidatus Sulfotelmatobacter sp.]